MTASELFRHRKRQVLAVWFSGAAVFIGSIVVSLLWPISPWVPVIGLCGFGVSFVTMMGAHFFGFRCPTCREGFPSLFLERASKPPVRYCPFCGEDFDSLPVDNDEYRYQRANESRE